jgi:hypothetical protein
MSHAPPRHPDDARRRLMIVAGAGWAGGLVGCAGPAGVKSSPRSNPPPSVAPPPPRGGELPPVPAPAPEPPVSPLAAESAWLKSLFDATPVQIADEADGAVLLTVPLHYAFESSAATAKPPVKAVLDKLAMSLRRQPTARLQLAAPAPMADQRALALRRQLSGAGVAAWRVATVAASRTDAVQLRLLPGVTALRQVGVPPDSNAAGTPPRR